MNEKIIQIASNLFEDDISIETKIGDTLAWDSLGQINLFMAIESELGLNFNPEDIIENDSIKKIVQLINNSK